MLDELGLEEGQGQAGPDDGDVRALAQQVGTPPMWSSWPWVSTIASILSRRSRIQVKSGRITSTPGWCSSGKSTPQSTMSSRPGVLEDGHVAPDLAESTQWDDSAARSGGGWGSAPVASAMASGGSSPAPVDGAITLWLSQLRGGGALGWPRTRRGLRSSCSPETNHDSKALGEEVDAGVEHGGRTAAPNADVSWARASS